MRRASWLFVFALLFPASRAEAECRVTGSAAAGGPADWARARMQLVEAVASADCESIRVDLAESGGVVVVRTTDGRVAERALARPDELVPTALALLATMPLPAEDDVEVVDEPALPPPETPSEAETAPDKRVLAPPAPRDTFTFGLQGGVRGGSDNLATMVVHGFASITVRRWEAGLLGGADLGYQRVGNEQPANMSMQSSSFNAGAILGRREPAGPFELLAGGRLVFAFIRESTRLFRPSDGFLASATSDPELELRTGVYGGAAFPRSSPIRVRGDIAFDIVPGHLGSNDEEHRIAAGASLPPSTPWWSTSLQLGLEVVR